VKKISKLALTAALTVGILAGGYTNNAYAISEARIKIGTEFSLTPNGKMLQVQDSIGKTVNAKTIDTLDAYYEDSERALHSYGTFNGVRYVDYDNFPVSKSSTVTQAYSTTNTKKKLTALNSKGKTVNVTIPQNTKVTKVNTTWYKGSITYTTYKKSGKKWVKQTKTQVVYLPSKYTKQFPQWKKLTKYTDEAYFIPWEREGITLAEYNSIKIGMSYEDIAELIGDKGTLTYDHSSSYTDTVYDEATDNWIEVPVENHSQTYSFEAPWGYGEATFDFENGVLEYKSQSDLK